MSAYELFDLIYSKRDNPLFLVYGFIFVICMYPFIKSAHEYLNAISSKNKVLQPEPVPSLNDEPTAQAIWQEINLTQFQHMLTALQSALKQSGYQLIFHGQGVHMHPHREEAVADNLMRARELFWAPNQPPDDIENLIASTRKSGYGKKMLREMLACCARRDWLLTPLRSDWELQAYPLRQVEIRVRGGIRTPVVDLLPCLEAMTKYVGQHPQNGAQEAVHRKGIFRAEYPDAPELEYDVIVRMVDDPPGFFPEGASIKLPPCAEQEKEHLRTTFKTQVTVFVQDTSAPRPEVRSAFYAHALEKIKNGEWERADYDDDTGYAFFVNYPDTALAPRDAYGKAKEICS